MKVDISLPGGYSNKINAIKAVRNVTDLSLKEAKAEVDVICANPSATVTIDTNVTVSGFRVAMEDVPEIQYSFEDDSKGHLMDTLKQATNEAINQDLIDVAIDILSIVKTVKGDTVIHSGPFAGHGKG